MKTYMELKLLGNKSTLDAFYENAKHYAQGAWSFRKDDSLLKDYLIFSYQGSKASHAEVFMLYRHDTRSQDIKVANIVPLDKSRLSIDEYNEVLKLFYRDIVSPYLAEHSEMQLEGPTSDIFDPLTYISKTALEKLNNFCISAKHSMGALHPYDEERWFEFVCQTVEDGKLFDYYTIKNFLMDDGYWGKRNTNSPNEIGSGAWNEEQAEELALEYVQCTNLLMYYRRTRGYE